MFRRSGGSYPPRFFEIIHSEVRLLGAAWEGFSAPLQCVDEYDQGLGCEAVAKIMIGVSDVRVWLLGWG